MAREIDEIWIEEAVARYRRIESLRAQFERALVALVVTVRSPDGTVEMLVNGAGEIKTVNLRAGARGRTDAELSRSIQLAVTAAADAGRWAREKMHAEVFGEYRPLEES